MDIALNAHRKTAAQPAFGNGAMMCLKLLRPGSVSTTRSIIQGALTVRIAHRHRNFLLAGILCAGAVGAQQPGSPLKRYTDYTPVTNDEIALINAEDQWCDAAIRRDAKILDEVFADDLVYLTSKGSMNKAQTIADYMNGSRILTLRLTEVVVRVFGDAAVVTSHVHVSYKSKGKVVQGIHPSTDVFVKRQGGWRLVST